MPKPDTLTKETIIKDCCALEGSFIYDPIEYRCVHILCWTLIAVLLFMGRLKWWALLEGTLIVYHLVMLIVCVVRCRQRQARIRRGEFTVSTDVLKYISTETIFEPYIAGRHAHMMREISKLYFTSLSHRLAYTSYYSWSKEYVLTPQGLLNTSNEGDEFYLILDNKTHDVLCVYNRNFFVWKDS